jgi:hypothetical protein
MRNFARFPSLGTLEVVPAQKGELMKKLLVLTALTAVAAAVPISGGAATSASSGVVVARSGHLIAVALPSGAVRTVESSSPARVGARVHLRGASVRVVGRARTAHIRGVVVRRTSGRLLLAAGRSLVTVRSSAARRLSGLSGGGRPAPGTVVDTTTAVTPSGQLALTSMTSGGTVGSIQVQATVKSVGPGVIVLTVNGQPLEFKLPNGLTLPSSLVGQTVTLTVNLAPGGAVATPGEENQVDDEDENDNDDGDQNQNDDGDQHQNDDGDQHDNHGGGGGDD